MPRNGDSPDGGGAAIASRSSPALRFERNELSSASAKRGESESASPRLVLAELNSLLSELTAGELRDAIAAPPPAGLSPFLANYIAAMVEYACAQRAIAVPAWTRSIAPLAEPVYGSELLSLRLYLLTHSPPPFRVRNIFIDATLGDRV